MGKPRVNKVFWKDPYLTELETRVTGVDGDDVTVECTIFFAFSGGQESDASNHRRRPRPPGPNGRPADRLYPGARSRPPTRTRPA
jgi:hypothetical protein